jgi:hypothetical protein
MNFTANIGPEVFKIVKTTAATPLPANSET